MARPEPEANLYPRPTETQQRFNQLKLIQEYSGQKGAATHPLDAYCTHGYTGTVTRSERLKAARIAAKYTQAEAAQCLNRAESTVKGWESGRSEPSSLTEVLRVCQLYKIDIEYYATGQKSSTEEQQLLSLFRQLPKVQRRALIVYLSELAQPSSKIRAED